MKYKQDSTKLIQFEFYFYLDDELFTQSNEQMTAVISWELGTLLGTSLDGKTDHHIYLIPYTGVRTWEQEIGTLM